MKLFSKYAHTFHTIRDPVEAQSMILSEYRGEIAAEKNSVKEWWGMHIKAFIQDSKDISNICEKLESCRLERPPKI